MPDPTRQGRPRQAAPSEIAADQSERTTHIVAHAGEPMTCCRACSPSECSYPACLSEPERGYRPDLLARQAAHGDPLARFTLDRERNKSLRLSRDPSTAADQLADSLGGRAWALEYARALASVLGGAR